VILPPFPYFGLIAFKASVSTKPGTGIDTETGCLAIVLHGEMGRRVFVEEHHDTQATIDIDNELDGMLVSGSYS
jgi:hypothetical protein